MLCVVEVDIKDEKRRERERPGELCNQIVRVFDDSTLIFEFKKKTHATEIYTKQLKNNEAMHVL